MNELQRPSDRTEYADSPGLLAVSHIDASFSHLQPNQLAANPLRSGLDTAAPWPTNLSLRASETEKCRL